MSQAPYTPRGGWQDSSTYGQYLRDPRTAYANALLGQGADTSPVQSWTQGLARLVQGGVGGYLGQDVRGEYEQRAADERVKAEAQAKASREALARALSGDTAGALANLPENPDNALVSVLAQRTAPQPAPQGYTRGPNGQLVLDQGYLQGQKQIALAQRAGMPGPAAPAAYKTFKGSDGADYVFNERTGQVQPLGSSKPQAGGPYSGNALDAQALNLLLNPSADPTSPAYATAYYQLYGPKVQEQNGVLTRVQPEAPPGIRAPGAAAMPAMPGPGEAPAPGVPGSSAAPAPGPAGMPQAQTLALPGGGSATRVTDPTRPSGTVEERNAAGLLQRAMDAGRVAEKLVESGYRAGNMRDGIAANTPMVGNFLMSDQGQMFNQAASVWITSILRSESGAAIPESEMARYVGQYFPVPGDGPGAIEQKRQARRDAERAATIKAGNAAPMISQSGAPAAAGAAPPPPPGFEIMP